MSRLEMKQVAPSVSASPYVLGFSDVRLYVLSSAFVLADVVVPWAFHQIHPLAGPTFLPMHLFVLLAGLLFGWRVGLLVGLFTPLISFLVSGMPILERLPQIMVEITVYGLAVGILRERLKFGVIWSLVGAMALGRLSLGLSVLVLYLNEVNPLIYMWRGVEQGWPGIAIQLVLLPVTIRAIDLWILKRRLIEKAEGC